MTALAKLARKPFRRALFFASGARFAAAREASLKMLEMTAGRVTTIWETFLGLRHGPMSAVNGDTLVVCFLSSDPVVRAYEADVLRELDEKRLGLARIIAGQDVTQNVACAQDLVIPYECPDIADEDLPVLDVIVGQLLALFRGLHEGLRSRGHPPGGSKFCPVTRPSLRPACEACRMLSIIYLFLAFPYCFGLKELVIGSLPSQESLQ